MMGSQMVDIDEEGSGATTSSQLNNQQMMLKGFFATEKINLPRGKVLLRTSYPSSAAGSLKPSPQKLVL